jgi:hypothetical protein
MIDVSRGAWVSDRFYGSEWPAPAGTSLSPWEQGQVAATNAYRHPETGHEITIIGIWHNAPPGFWMMLRADLDELAGKEIIQLEGVVFTRSLRATAFLWLERQLKKCAPDGDWSGPEYDDLQESAGDDELLVYEGNEHDLPGLSQYSLLDGWAGPPESVTMHDVEGSHLIRDTKLGWLLLAGLFFSIPGIQRFVGNRSGLINAIDSVLELSGIWPEPEKMMGERETIAIHRAIAETWPVTMIWGELHLEGMDALLRAHGYERQYYELRRVELGAGDEFEARTQLGS